MEILRSLENYKKMHEEKAKKDGTYAELMRATTPTYARKVVFGPKTKVINCGTCRHKSCVCGKK